MAVCGNCGAQGARVRSRWDKGVQLPDECPQCAPQSFEKFTAPSDKKIWMGYEAHPNEYVKAEDGGYDRKPEYRAEQEGRLQRETEDERLEREAVEASKRANRRTNPLDASETLAALAKARLYANAIEQSALEEENERRKAELDQWVAKSAQA